jgi:hypothetical protein
MQSFPQYLESNRASKSMAPTRCGFRLLYVVADGDAEEQPKRKPTVSGAPITQASAHVSVLVLIM